MPAVLRSLSDDVARPCDSQVSIFPLLAARVAVRPSTVWLHATQSERHSRQDHRYRRGTTRKPDAPPADADGAFAIQPTRVGTQPRLDKMCRSFLTRRHARTNTSRRSCTEAATARGASVQSTPCHRQAEWANGWTLRQGVRGNAHPIKKPAGSFPCQSVGPAISGTVSPWRRYRLCLRTGDGVFTFLLMWQLAFRDSLGFSPCL